MQDTASEGVFCTHSQGKQVHKHELRQETWSLRRLNWGASRNQDLPTAGLLWGSRVAMNAVTTSITAKSMDSLQSLRTIVLGQHAIVQHVKVKIRQATWEVRGVLVGATSHGDTLTTCTELRRVAGGRSN